MTTTTRRALLAAGAAAALALAGCREVDRAGCNTNCDSGVPPAPPPAKVPEPEAPALGKSFRFEDPTGAVGTLKLDVEHELIDQLIGWRGARGGADLRYGVLTVDNTAGSATLGVLETQLMHPELGTFESVVLWTEVYGWRDIDDTEEQTEALDELTAAVDPEMPPGAVVETIVAFPEGGMPDEFGGGLIYLGGFYDPPAVLEVDH